MNVTILLCTLAFSIGFPLGYYLAWCWDEADRLLEAYLQGTGDMALYSPEMWR